MCIRDSTCHFIVTPAVIEFPVGWLDLTLADGCLHISLRQLPLPDLIERSRDGRPGDDGASQEWRAGRPEWRDLVIDFAP